MAYPVHYRLQFGGTLFAEEIWSCGLAIGDPADDLLLNPTQGQLDAMAAAVSAWVADGASRLSSAVKLSFVKLNAIGTDGNYADPEASFEKIIEPVVTGVGNAYLPPQCSLVVSLLTAAERGRGHMGRFYPPTFNISVDGEGKAPNMSRLDIGNAAVSLINAVNAAAPGTTQVIVASSFGPRRPVTGVKVGRVIDTQRRRRNQMGEDYTALPL